LIKKIIIGSKIEIKRKNFFDENLRDADLIFVFLVDAVMEKLGNKLNKNLKPGAIVVSYGFEIPGWKPEKILNTNLSRTYFLKSMKTASPIILGIDPGIADTGFGIIKKIDGSRMACLDYGSIKTKANTELAERLEIINKELSKIIKRHKPDLIAVEQLFFCKNVKTALVVGQARGVMLLTARQNKIPTVEFTPLQVKQAVSSYGQAPKMQVQKMVKLLLNLKEIPKPDDAADALAIAICAGNSSRNA